MSQIILITGASSGFGAMATRALARAGHRVLASILQRIGLADLLHPQLTNLNHP